LLFFLPLHKFRNPKMKPIAKFNLLYENLSSKQKNQLLSEINLIPTIQIKNIVSKCPYCDGKNFIKHARYKGTFRFKCKTCNKTFLPTTGSSMHYINKRVEFIQYAEIMRTEGVLSIAKMAKRLNISVVTAFDWRHKILLSIPQQENLFNNELHCSDLWFLHNEKGRRGIKNPRKRGVGKRRVNSNYQAKLIAASDLQQVEMKLAKIGKITKEDLVRTMGNKISKETTLISDTHSCFVNFAKDKGLKHRSIILKNCQTSDEEDITYINNLSERIRIWINRIMRGVSTKYLQLYTNYFAFCEKISFDAMNKSFINQKQVWPIYGQIEVVYKDFIEKYSQRSYRCPVKKERKYSARFLVAANEFPY